MKRLQIIHILPPNSRVTSTAGGAVERVVLSLAERQSELGHDVTIFSANEVDEGRLDSGLLIKGVRVRLPRPLSDIEYLLRVRSQTRRLRYQVLHAHSSPFAAILLGRTETVSIATLNFFRFRGSQSRAGRHIYRHLLNRFSLTTSITHYSADATARYYDLLDVPTVLNCGVNLKEFTQVAQDLHNELPLDFPKGPVVLYVGRINEQKGSHLLEPLALRLRESGVSVVACGPLKQFHLSTQNVTDNVLGPTVVYLGVVEQKTLPRIMSAADILILPTITDEMFGMVLIEAGACGTPAVASRLDAIPEVLNDAGLTFTPGSVDEMFSCISEILNDKKLLQELSLRAVKNAQRFDWDRITEESIKLYLQELVKKVV